MTNTNQSLYEVAVIGNAAEIPMFNDKSTPGNLPQNKYEVEPNGESSTEKLAKNLYEI